MTFSPSSYRFQHNARCLFLRACLLVWLLISPTILFSQNISSLDIEKVPDDGLTNENISCINQDKNGFMWFGTTEGLFKYDGYSFKAFRNIPGNPATLANNVISTLYPEDNKLWVGTVIGLSCIDINTNTIKNFSPGKASLINTILPKDDNGFWVATQGGLYQFNKNTYKWKMMPVMGGNIPVNYMTDDHEGHLYLSSHNGIYCYTKSSGACSFYYFNLPRYPKLDQAGKFRLNIGRSAMDHEGNLWMSSFEAGLIRFNTKTKKVDSWSHQSYNVSLLPYITVSMVFADKSDNIWLANIEGGLTVFNPSKNQFTNYPVDWKSENKISDGVISLFSDQSGIVWIGTENGIFKYDPHHIYLEKAGILLKTGARLLPANFSTLTMMKDGNGLWWLGTYTGVWMYNEKTGIATDAKDRVGFAVQPSFAVFNIVRDKQGGIWLSAKNMLVKAAGKSGGKAYFFSSKEITSKIRSLYIDNENKIWLGTHGDGVFTFDPISKKIIACHFNGIDPGLKMGEIRAFCELGKDSLLMGGLGTGLLLYHKNTGRLEKINLGNLQNVGRDFSVNTIYKSGGSFWIGTEENGVLQVTNGFKTSLNITANDGLPSMAINSIQGDGHNNLWLSTNSGIVRFQPGTKKITVFDKRDGIQNLNELNTLVVDGNNRVSVTGRGAFYSFDEANISKNEAAPEVWITGMRVFDKDYTIQKGETITLNYNQNYFSFDYVALNYTQSRLNKYAYKMDGLDHKWNYAGSNRRVSYDNLDEGTYIFSVKACNNDGVWNNVPATLILIIKPPFWHRWWFYSLVTLFVAGVLYGIYVYNINQLKIRLQMRDKIASDLHDDIGSTLSGINIFSKIALQKMGPGQAGIELIEKISEKSQSTLEALSDIVWSINTRNDGMDNFVMKANEYLAELDAQHIAYDFTADEDVDLIKLDMGFRKELYLIFKEAICNASKYASCSFIQVYLTRHKDNCTLTIHDNGKGFDVNAVSSGNGTYNMRQRAKKMNARLKIESEENKGTTISINFKITR